MSERHATRLAWSLLGLTAVLLTAMTFLSVGREPGFDTVLYGLQYAVMATAGALIASTHPRNPIGWLFCGLAAFGAFAEVAEGWGYFAADKGLPAGEWGEWIASWAGVGGPTLWTIVLVLFPDGRPPSRRWRFAPWIAGAGCGLALPGQALSSRMGSQFADGQNPLAVKGLAIDLLFGVGTALLVAALLGAVISLVARFRRADPVERQQLKWFAYAASGLGVVGPLAAVFYHESILVQVALALALIALPVAAGIAILRYRLYDIDVVINRTLVYGALTATLAGIYLGSVLVLQLALSGVTKGSGLAVAASTLGVATLFRPARERIQRIVDRRFYRRKYDAARTLERFGARLRDEVDLDALGADLRAVVNDTMQPAHVSLWLRERLP